MWIIPPEGASLVVEVCVGGLSLGHVKLERPAQAEVHECLESAQEWRLHLRTAGVFLLFKATRLHEVALQGSKDEMRTRRD